MRRGAPDHGAVVLAVKAKDNSRGFAATWPHHHARETEGTMPDPIDRIRTKRVVDYLLHITWYCEGGSCPVRTLDVFVKDHDGTLVARLERRPPVCPVCRRPSLSLHAVKTAREFDATDAADARSAVNVQRYLRDHPTSGLPIVPLSVFLDESLPP
jgi:hypothetical protein